MFAAIAVQGPPPPSPESWTTVTPATWLTIKRGSNAVGPGPTRTDRTAEDIAAATWFSLTKFARY